MLFIARCDSDNSSQFLTNTDDIIQVFDALDLSGSVPLFFVRLMNFFICHPSP